MANTIQVDIVSAEEHIFSGEAEMVFAPAVMGEVGIAPRHTPLISPLKPGEVRLDMGDGKEEFFFISGGILEVQPHIVTVLSDTASVTVYAPNCTDADAMATALFVMGADEGIDWIEKRPDAEAMFLVRTGNGEIIERFSSRFMEATGYISEIVRNTGKNEN